MKASARQPARISATVDPALLKAVDEFLVQHPGYDRSKVIDEALGLWYARQQDVAMAAQFAGDPEVDSDEWTDWRAIRDKAAARLLRSSDID